MCEVWLFSAWLTLLATDTMSPLCGEAGWVRGFFLACAGSGDAAPPPLLLGEAVAGCLGSSACDDSLSPSASWIISACGVSRLGMI